MSLKNKICKSIRKYCSDFEKIPKIQTGFGIRVSSGGHKDNSNLHYIRPPFCSVSSLIDLPRIYVYKNKYIYYKKPSVYDFDTLNTVKYICYFIHLHTDLATQKRVGMSR